MSSYWTCRRHKDGKVCLYKNPARKQLCERCGGRKPKRKRPPRPNFADCPAPVGVCWLKPFSAKERACEGRLDRAHLIPQQLLRREGLGELCPDPRLWVPACRWHHSQFDGYAGVMVPRAAIPALLETLAVELGLDWYLDRRYGLREAAA